MSSIDFPEKISSLLEKGNLHTASAILTTSDVTFKKLGLSEEDIDLIRRKTSENIFPGFMTAAEAAICYPHKWRRLSFNCQSLDRLTEGGIPFRGITEIAGESGSGKTQICMQLALSVQLEEQFGGYGKGAIFIFTENAFSSKRLRQLIEAFKMRNKDKNCQNINFSDNIFIETVKDLTSLMACILVRLPQFLVTHQIGLVVIDSVAAIFRTETNAVTRADDMRKLVRELTTLSNTHEFATICVNQVTSVIDSSIDSGKELLVPSLGLAWANLVTTRLQIYRTNEVLEIAADNEDRNKSEIVVRKMEILFSPVLPRQHEKFIITKDGICDL